MSVEDYVGYGWCGLLEAAQRFDAARGIAFSTFAFYRIRGAVIDGARLAPHISTGRSGRMMHVESIDGVEVVDEAPSPHDLLEDEDERAELRRAVIAASSRLRDSEREILSLYASGMSMQIVAAQVGLCKSWVSRQVDRASRRLARGLLAEGVDPALVERGRRTKLARCAQSDVG
jgi:RNA polymerase sigma factor for flagellar operon FliA